MFKKWKAIFLKKKWKMPSSFAILLTVVMLLIFVSWILKWAQTKNIKALGVLDSVHVVLETFSDRASLVVFIFVIGAFIKIMFATQALEAGIGKLINKLKGKEIYLIPVIMILFSIGGTTFGMAEETIPFYLILLPIFIAAGFDAMSGFLVILLGAGTGTVASILNPFNIPVATSAINDSVNGQVINESSGIAFRIIGYFLIVSLTITFVTHYAYRTKKEKRRSVVYDIKDNWNDFLIVSSPELTKKRKWTLVVFSFSFLLLIFCLLAWNSFGISFFQELQKKIMTNFPYFETQYSEIGNFGYIDMAALFVFASIIIYLINRQELKKDGYFKLFFSGASDLIAVAGIIVVATSIQGVMRRSKIDKLVIQGLNDSLGGLNPYLFIFIIFIVFLIIATFIPSSSGFAGAIFPIFGPTTVALGLASGTITAFTYASGITNLLAPTSGTFSAVLAVAKMPYDRYLKLVWPFMIVLVILCFLILLIGVSVASPSLNSLF